MASWCIGIDLGGTFIKFGLLDRQNVAKGIFQLPTPPGRGFEGVVEQMTVGVRRLLDEHGLAVDDVAGIGIGAPGPLDLSAGVVIAMPNVPGMENAPIRDRVADAVGLPAVLENDANAAGFGEFLAGAGKGTQNMVLLTLGTGVGGGIVVDGKVLHGSHEIGAELGHMIVEPAGLECGCGQRGCIERYCSATFLAQWAQRQIREGRASSLSAKLETEGQIDARDINEARKAGDELAEEVWQRAAYYLAIGCVNVCRIFDPDEIVLGGGLAKAGDDLLQPVCEQFAKLHWKLTEPMTKIAIASLGNDAGVIGAAGVAWSAFAEETAPAES